MNHTARVRDLAMLDLFYSCDVRPAELCRMELPNHCTSQGGLAASRGFTESTEQRTAVTSAVGCQIMRRTGRCGLHLLVLIGSLVMDANLVSAAPKGIKIDAGQWLSNETGVVKFAITLDDSALAALRQHPRAYVKGGVASQSEDYSEVGFHLKGNYGTFQPLERKPSLTLNFDKFTKAQHFQGMDKLHLNNSVSDPSFMTELLCRELFAAAGLPAARVSHARVSINDRDRGLFVLVEGHDKTFLRRFFTNPNGNLYDSEYLHDITDRLRRASGKGTNDHADLKALAQAAQEFAGRATLLRSPNQNSVSARQEPRPCLVGRPS